ncbi:MAG: helix-turn-helix transcriptional regulator, partial [Pseudomonadota bacterium]
DAAREIGIEQSYLSKLEAGKSYPSEDVFSSLVAAYGIEISDLHDTLFPAELDRLRDITQVRSVILQGQKDQRQQTQRWLYAGLAALILGGACLGAASLAADSERTQYQYRSYGVSETPESEPTVREERFILRDDYRDVVYTESVPDGVIQWRFFGARTEMVSSPLRWFMIPAFAFLLGAVGCFFASYRMR